MIKKKFTVKGMHCKACEMIIKEAVSEIHGVKNVDVNLSENLVIIDYDTNQVKEENIVKTIEKEGYHVRK